MILVAASHAPKLKVLNIYTSKPSPATMVFPAPNFMLKGTSQLSEARKQEDGVRKVKYCVETDGGELGLRGISGVDLVWEGFSNQII